MYLFIDTTENITVAIINEQFEWSCYRYLENKKSSSEIHFLINEMLEQESLELKSLSGVFYSAGPGSYTGMRVSEGIIRVFEWHKIEIFSFYHYEIPYLVGVNSGCWVSKAFKGEFFIYEWDLERNSHSLKPSVDFDLSKIKNIHFGHQSINELDAPLTKELIYNNPKSIFSEIQKNKVRKDLFYYRSLEQEYGVK